MRHFIKFMIALSLMLGANVASAAALQNHMTLNNCADNQLCVARIQYDFTKDGGAVGPLDVATAGQNIVIVGAWTKVLTTATSGGAALYFVGVTGDTDRIGAFTVGQLSAGSYFMPPVVEGTPNVIATPHPLLTGQKVIQDIAAAAFTAGKIEHVILYFKP